MVNTELYEILRLGKLTTFINPEYVSLVAIVEVEMYEGPDELEWWTPQYCGIEEEVDGGGINNGEG